MILGRAHFDGIEVVHRHMTQTYILPTVHVHMDIWEHIRGRVKASACRMDGQTRPAPDVVRKLQEVCLATLTGLGLIEYHKKPPG